MSPPDQIQVHSRHSALVTALRAAEYDVVEVDLPDGLKAATVLRKGWMFVGTVHPVGSFGSSVLTLHGHNNTSQQMAAFVNALLG